MSDNKIEGAHVIDVNELVISMTNKRNEKKTQFPFIHKIKRIPCDAEVDVYEPCIVSIGPYHYKTEATLEMEKTKWKVFSCILGWNPEKKMRDYLEAIAELEQQIRNCYANEIKIDRNEFLKMVLIDGCFMLYYILCVGSDATRAALNLHTLDDRVLRLDQNVFKPATSISNDASHQTNINSTDHVHSQDDTYYSKQLYPTFLAHDLLLLENQVPFFVVMKIYELMTDRNSSIPSLLDTVLNFMDYLLRSYPKADLSLNGHKDIHHLLHLCHLFFKPNKKQVKSNSDVPSCPNLITSYVDEGSEERIVIAGQELLGWHQATEYHKAGVEFQKQEFCTEYPHSLLDIRFCEGILEMPCLTIDPNTYCLFRNLIAFEETCPQFGNYISTYVVFLSQFIKVPEDVSLVTKRGIIVHQLDSDAEVCDLFRKLVEGVTFDFNGNHNLIEFCHAIETHYQIQRPRWRESIGSVGTKILGWARESKPN